MARRAPGGRPARRLDHAAVERDQAPAALRDDAEAGVGDAGVDAEDDHAEVILRPARMPSPGGAPVIRPGGPAEPVDTHAVELHRALGGRQARRAHGAHPATAGGAGDRLGSGRWPRPPTTPPRGCSTGWRARAREEREELLEWLHRDQGIGFDDLREASASGTLLFLGARGTLGGGSEHSAREIAERTGVPLDLYLDLRRANGFPDVRDPDACVLGPGDLESAELRARSSTRGCTATSSSARPACSAAASPRSPSSCAR